MLSTSLRVRTTIVCSFSSEDYTLELASGERLESYYIYRSRRGVIRDSLQFLRPLSGSRRLLEELLEGQYTLAHELGIKSPDEFSSRMSEEQDLRNRFAQLLKVKRLVRRGRITSGDASDRQCYLRQGGFEPATTDER